MSDHKTVLEDGPNPVLEDGPNPVLEDPVLEDVLSGLAISIDGQEAGEPIAASAVAADGLTYKLGNLDPETTILAVKQKLATLSEMNASSQTVYLVEDIRGDKLDDLELKDHQTVREVSKYSPEGPGELQFAVMLGLRENVAEFLKELDTSDEIVRVSGIQPQMKSPFAVAFVPTHPELLAVSEHTGNCIKIYHQQAQSLLCTFDGLKGPWGVAVTADAEHVLVVEQAGNRVQVLRLVVAIDGSTASLEFVHYIGDEQREDGKGTLNLPNGIAMRRTGTRETVLVADGAHHRVVEFELDGTFIKTIGDVEFELVADLSSKLRFPAAVTVLPASGHVVVAEYQGNCIAIFDGESGALVRKFGKTGGAHDGQFDRPGALTCDVQGNILVIDNGSGRVQAFSETGEHLCTRNDLSVHESDVKGIAWNADTSCLAIANGYNNRVLVLRSSSQ
jgi:DNA-binding beta-propeller fold protein YncE